MKYIIQVIIALGLITLALFLLLPYQNYPIEHFEQSLIQIIPLSWKLIAVLARLLIGLLFVLAAYLIFNRFKNEWLNLITYAMVSLPFIINPVYFQDLKLPVSKLSNQPLIFDLNATSNEKVLVAYLSYNCSHCKEAAKKLDAAVKANKNFTKVKVISYNFKLKEYFNQNHINLPLDTILPQQFMEITQGSFPKYQLIQNNIVIEDWATEDFNYAVYDNLSLK
jgi:thiol-disulfide isomerase/thioredoxin